MKNIGKEQHRKTEAIHVYRRFAGNNVVEALLKSSHNAWTMIIPSSTEVGHTHCNEHRAVDFKIR